MTKPLILIVEGDARMQAVYHAIFHGHEREFTYHLVQSGEAALRFVEEKPVDLLVLAADLPRMPGLDVLQLVRAKEATKGLPVVVVTQAENPEERLAALRNGADHYQTKCFVVEELLARIRRLLERKASLWSGLNPFSWLHVAQRRSHNE